MTLRYTAYDWEGRKVTGLLEADSEEDAYEQLQSEDLIPYKLEQVKERRTLVQIAPSLFKPKPKELIDFTQQLSALLSAGIPLHRALILLRDEASGKGLKEALTRVVVDIEQGTGFSDACERQSWVFPSFYTRLLKVGEASGGITSSLQRLAASLEKRRHVRSKVKSALTYPAISLVVAVIAGGLLVTFALPSLVGLLEEFDSEMPFMTRMMIALADAAEAYGGYVMVGGVLFVVLAFLYFRTEQGARVRDKRMLGLPVMGRVLVQSNMFNLTSTLASLLDSGVPPVEALRLSKEAMGNVVLKEALERVIQQASGGVGLGRAFREEPLFPPLLSQGITTGESTGNLTTILHGLALYYEQETEKSVSGATELIQPAVIILVAGAVGFVAVAVISGIYSTLGAICRPSAIMGHVRGVENPRI